jgi:integrase
MPRRRGRGEGSITQRADGRWMGRVDMGRGPDGRRQRKTVYGATREDVAKKLNIQLGRASTGELLTTGTPTLKSWLNDWFKTHQDDWRPATQRAYRVAIDQWIVPTLGPLRLEQVKPATVQKWINQATADGGRPRTLLAHCVLRSALAWAMTQRVLTYNAAALCKVPRPTPKVVTPLTADQGRQLLEAAGGHRLGAMVIVTLTMGLRIGEASGLSWAAVDLDTRTLRIEQQLQALGKDSGLTLAPLKTRNSRRTLALPALAVKALKGHRKAQLAERLRAGADWKNDHDLVFTTAKGHPVHPSHLRKVLAALLTAAGLPQVRYHALRHTAATLLLLDGTPLFDVSRVLGHSEISTTSDIYGHLVPEMTAGAAARMDTLLKARKA